MCAEHAKKPKLDQLRAISARQESFAEQEKRGLARRMHNELSQKTTVLGLELSLLAMDAESVPAKKLKEKVIELSALVADLSQSIRGITNEVYPRILDEFGLVDALQWYGKSLEKELRCVVVPPPKEISLPLATNQVLFNLTKALVAHIFRPAKVSHLEIRFEEREEQLRLRLSGEHKSRWKQAATPEAGLDWLAIQEQALRVGGKLKLTTVAGVGTTVVCAIPAKGTVKKTKSTGKKK